MGIYPIFPYPTITDSTNIITYINYRKNHTTLIPRSTHKCKNNKSTFHDIRAPPFKTTPSSTLIFEGKLCSPIVWTSGTKLWKIRPFQITNSFITIQNILKCVFINCRLWHSRLLNSLYGIAARVNNVTSVRIKLYYKQNSFLETNVSQYFSLII